VVRFCLAVLALLPLTPLFAQAPDKAPKAHEPFSAATFSGLKLRSIGPAVTSGRVIALAVDPKNPSHYYVAAASGGVWKTTNAGTTWAPVFDKEGSYSIGAVALDPKNPGVVWVGTGENNSQRSVSYGDGVYRSDDGGKSWRNVGLKDSQHVGRILIDPRNSNVVYVAAQGPLWNAGGDRGLYKTTDGGKTWKKVLSISENTGVTDVALDPRNPDVLLAAAYQRRRHVWTLIDGGPESAIHKSTDGGASWKKLATGLPKTELGRISLAVAPSNPDVVYAGVESIDKKGGVFRSADRGETWERRNDFDQGAMYFAGVVVDPKNADRVYVMGVYLQVSDDGGKTLKRLGSKWRHVDDHALWIDPRDNNHYRVGCDGGVYESHDRGANWAFVANLPITQFYDICVDETGPFYNVYGGTQDNFSLGGPARTRSVHGITNSDWFVLQGGDGFQCRVDPKDPNTVYCEMQYGVLTRYDRRSGQNLVIQPQPGKGQPPLRWNWDSPLVISPHDHKRLYFAANILFRSDDRGDSWKPVSPDLTRQLDRDKLPVMGKLWGPDAVAKHQSTSFYGNCIALSESPKKEGLIYVGTDDGLVQVTEDGGEKWRKAEKFPGVPDKTYVTRILASQHSEGTVYLAFDNHKNGDFAPYLLKSTDAGRTWQSIKGDLPERGSVLAIAEDHVQPDLLFVGTEFGLFFTVDGGKKWVRLKGGLPTIAVKDLAIQRQVNDLAVGTFGRGIYILDDYSPLREATPELLAKEAALFPVREAQLYVPSRQFGLPGKAFLGSSFFTADNPPFGATFTYYLKETIKTQKEKRRDAEKKAEKKGAPPYPNKEQLRAEAEEEAPQILLTVMDAKGKVLRTLTGPVAQGLHRVSWDLREPGPVLPKAPVKEADEDVFAQAPRGPLVLPGTYKVALAKRVGGVTTPLGLERSFLVVPDSPDLNDLAGRKELYEFQQKVLRLQRAVAGALDTANDLTAKLERIKRTLEHTPGPDAKWKDVVRRLEQKNRDILRALRGDKVLAARSENVPHSVSDRVSFLARSHRYTLQRPTQAQRREYDIASEEFAAELGKLRTLIEKELPPLQRALEEAGAPWVPGRLPEWKGK
jgi:photosystem II stability/assembly factor-like uncharacterized protein